MRQIRIILIGIILSLTCVAAYAQQSRDISIDNRHNIRLSLSAPGLMSYFYLVDNNDTVADADAIHSTSDLLASARYFESPTRYLPGINLEYSCNIKPWLSLGGKATFAATWSSMRHVSTNELLYRNNRIATALILNLRFDYLRKPIINLYSAVGAGIAARFAYDDGVVTPMYDLTFFGLTLGRKVYFFAEVGAGISGSLRAGVGYRF